MQGSVNVHFLLTFFRRAMHVKHQRQSYRWMKYCRKPDITIYTSYSQNISTQYTLIFIALFCFIQWLVKDGSIYVHRYHGGAGYILLFSRLAVIPEAIAKHSVNYCRSSAIYIFIYVIIGILKEKRIAFGNICLFDERS